MMKVATLMAAVIAATDALLSRPDWILVEDPKTWFDARHYCFATYGSDLVSGVDAALGNEIYAAAKGYVWIGLHDNAKEGSHEWVDGRGAPSVTNWVPGMPDDAGNTEDCVHVGYLADGRWNDHNCMNKFKFACASNEASTVTPVPVTWVLVQQNKKYDDAKAYCQSEFGSTLAGVDDWRANQAMYDEALRETWIGFNDRSSEGSFSWEDGRSRAYANWAKGQPDNFFGEDCATIGYTGEGLWNDRDCNDALWFFCNRGSDASQWHVVRRVREYDDAESCCKARYGSELVTVQSSAMGLDIKNTAGQRVWIGASDRDSEGEWRLPDGTQASFTDWQAGQPSDSVMDENCAEIGLFGTEKWNDLSCRSQLAFVCGTAAPADKSGRNRDWVHVRESKRWDDARNYCKVNYGTDLAPVPDGETGRVMYSEAKQRSWLGLSEKAHPGTFEWNDGVARSFTRWHLGEPNEVTLQHTCVEFGYFGDDRWDDMNCFEKHPFFCALSGSGFSPVGSNFVLVRELKNFDDANNYCAGNYGTQLATVPDYRADMAMFDEVRTYAWVGLDDRATEGQFQWQDGSASAYRHWAYGQPDNAANIEDCTVIGYTYSGQWNDFPCTNRYYFFCEAPLNAKTFRSVQKLATYEDAENHCRATYGTDLAVITTAAQADDMYDDTRAETWFGMSDRDSEGSWTLPDGSAPSFVNWRAGQPDDFASNEDCAEIGYGGLSSFNDHLCTLEHKFLCQSAVATTTTTTTTTTSTSTTTTTTTTTTQAPSTTSKAYVTPVEKSTWQGANQKCKDAYPGSPGLRIIDSAEENAALVQTMLDTGVVNAWIGFNDRATEGVWIWNDDSSAGSGYTNWLPNNPDDANLGEDCAVIGVWGSAGNPDDRDGKWNDQPCHVADKVAFCEPPPEGAVALGSAKIAVALLSVVSLAAVAAFAYRGARLAPKAVHDETSYGALSV